MKKIIRILLLIGISILILASQSFGQSVYKGMFYNKSIGGLGYGQDTLIGYVFTNNNTLGEAGYLAISYQDTAWFKVDPDGNLVLKDGVSGDFKLSELITVLDTINFYNYTDELFIDSMAYVRATFVDSMQYIRSMINDSTQYVRDNFLLQNDTVHIYNYTDQLFIDSMQWVRDQNYVDSAQLVTSRWTFQNSIEISDTLDIATIEADTIRVDFMEYVPPHAYLAFSDSAVTLDITEDVWTQITNDWTSLFSVYDSDMITSENDEVTVIYPGSYLHNVSISFSGTNNETWGIALFKNGNKESSKMQRYTSTNDTGNVGFSCYSEAILNDSYQIRIVNNTDSDNCVIKSGSWVILQVYHSP